VKNIILLLGLMLTFSLGNAQAQSGKKAEPNKIKNKTEMMWVSVEQQPRFPGGEQALNEWIYKNIKYPAEAKAKKIEGTVLIHFMITKTGDVDSVKIAKDLEGGCGAEAARVIQSMPKWRPGKSNGQFTNVYFTVPVSFKLEQ